MPDKLICRKIEILTQCKNTTLSKVIFINFTDQYLRTLTGMKYSGRRMAYVEKTSTIPELAVSNEEKQLLKIKWTIKHL